MKRISSFTRIAVLLVCAFIMQALFWGRAAEVKADTPSYAVCHDGLNNEDGGTSAMDCADSSVCGSFCENTQAECTNDADDNGDGRRNCADPDCASYCSPPNIVLIVADDMGWGDLNVNSPWECTSTGISNKCTMLNCNTESYRTDIAHSGYCQARTNNTPELNTLANEGVRLTNFYTPTPVCSPARGALLTGKHPLRHGGIDNQSYPFIQGTEKTLAEALKDVNSSYRTAAIGKWHVGWDETKKPQNQGFDYSYVLPTGLGNTVQFCLVEDGLLNVVNDLPKREYTYYNDNYVSQSEQGSVGEKIYNAQCPSYDESDNKLNIKNFWSTGSVAYDYTDGGKAHYKSLTRVMTDKAIQFITNEGGHYRQQSNAPFFLYLAYAAPHLPLKLHVPDYPPPHNLTSSVAYERSIREINDNVGSILDCLKGNNGSTCTGCDNGARCSAGVCAGSTTTCTPAPDISNNTTVVFTSDNGPWLGFQLENTEGHPTASTGGLKGGKQFTFEGGIRVPFIARWPNGYLSGKTSSQPADLMDIFTTLLAAANAANGTTPLLSSTIDGKDLTPVLSGNGCIDKTIHSFSPFALRAPDDGGSGLRFAYQYAIQDFSASNQCASSSNYYKLFYSTSSTDIACGPQGSGAINYPPVTLFGPTDTANYCWPYNDYGKNDYGEGNYFKKGLYYLNYNESPNSGNETTAGDINSDIANNLLTKAFSFHRTAVFKYRYYFPSIKDNDSIGWQNYIHVQAKDAVKMDVKFTVYDMNGTLKGTYIYSDTDPAANEKSILPNVKAAQRPSWIAGFCNIFTGCSGTMHFTSGVPDNFTPLAVEGSVIIETNVPAIASTNTIANNYKGFDIYEAAKPHSVHTFGKNYDGPNYYQVYILIQNIYDTPRNVTIKLIAKNSSGGSNPGDGATRTVDIAPHATYKVRPSDIAGGINFNGSVVVYSNRFAPEDGLGLPIPAMNRTEAGTEALTIYESSVPQRSPLTFPHIRDGKFGGSLDYQNYLTIFNPSGNTAANVTIVLYNNSGVEEGRLSNQPIQPGGKITWRPSWIKGTATAPIDFEGSIVVTTDIPVVGQTNIIYPGANHYNNDAYAIYDSSIPSNSLLFLKNFDNKLSDGHMTDVYVYIQNPEATAQDIHIEQFNKDGLADGEATIPLGPHATHKYRPYTLVTDGTGQFNGSVKVTAATGRKIAGVVKYELHQTNLTSSKIDGMTVYRSMGQ